MDKLKTILSKTKMPKVKISLPKPRIKVYIVKAIPIASKSLKLFLKGLKGFIRWFGKAVKESIAQVWTLLGFFIAWLTLTGTAQQIVGIATLAATVLWLVTIPLREEKE